MSAEKLFLQFYRSPPHLPVTIFGGRFIFVHLPASIDRIEGAVIWSNVLRRDAITALSPV